MLWRRLATSRFVVRGVTPGAAGTQGIDALTDASLTMRRDTTQVSEINTSIGSCHTHTHTPTQTKLNTIIR